MSDENSENAEAPKKGKLGLIVVILLVGVSGAVGYALPSMLDGEKPKPADENTLDVELPEPAGKPAFIEFGETVANLNDGRMTRYLRLGITLQVDEAQLTGLEQLLETRRAVLRNWLLSHISDKSMDDIRGRAGQARLRREILEHFNVVLFPDGIDRIQDVLFQEFNVQ